MRYLALLGLVVVLLAVEGAIGRLFHIELLQPDPVLVLVVFIAFHLGPGGVLLVFASGLVADSAAGAPHGLLTSTYLLVWIVVRATQGVFLPDRKSVQLGMLFVMSLVSTGLVLLMLRLADRAGGLTSALLIWMLPLALLNLFLAWPVWAIARRIALPASTKTRRLA